MAKMCCTHGGNFDHKTSGKPSLGDLGLNGRIILKLIVEKYGVKLWIGVNWLRTGSNGRFNSSFM